jgi:hypothetical protein
LATGLSTSAPVSSEKIRNTCSSGSPRASASCQPVNASEIGFINVIFPSASVAITASPMLRSVMSSHRRASSSRSKRAARTSACAQCMLSVSTNVRSSGENLRGS